MSQNTCNQSYYRIAEPGEGASFAEGMYVLSAGESLIKESFSRNYHLRGDYELIYLIGGEMDITLDGVDYKMKRGDVLCRRPLSDLTIRTPEPMEEWVRYYWIHFCLPDGDSFTDRCAIRCGAPFAVAESKDVMEEYETLFSEFRTRGALFDMSLSLSVKRILMLFGRLKDNPDAGKLDKSLRYIHSNFRHRISVSELATLEFLGVSRYRDLFRNQMGMSPIEYITALRVEKAKDLLGQGDLSLATVASLVGYDDVHYFQRVFKNSTGFSAGEYRRSLKNK